MEMVLEVMTLLRSVSLKKLGNVFDWDGDISSSYLFRMRACIEYYTRSVFRCIIYSFYAFGRRVLPLYNYWMRHEVVVAWGRLNQIVLRRGAVELGQYKSHH